VTEPLKAVCRRCQVREECLGYALADGTLLGVWGGTSMWEPERYRRLDRGSVAALDRSGAARRH
jgi:WhiB family redox-sensing transcriptional regulator